MRIVVLLRSRRSLPLDAAHTPRIGFHEAQALVQGTRLVGALPGSTLTVLTAGNEGEDPVLMDALARGAGRVFRLWDPLLEQVDSLGVARALAAAVQHLGFDLVLTGARSPDESLGFMGPALGEVLGVPHLTDALGLGWDEARSWVVAERCAASRRYRHFLSPPCLITVQGALEESVPQEASAPDNARPQVLSLTDIGLDETLLRPRCRLKGELRPYSAPPYVTAWAEDASTVVEHLRDLDLL